MILSSFYIGYMLTHIPGGILAERFGGKWTLGLGILSTAGFTVLTPITVEKGGAYGLIVLRILMGLGEGTTFPALSALLASWVPERERSKIGSFVFGGGQVKNLRYECAVERIRVGDLIDMTCHMFFFPMKFMKWQYDSVEIAESQLRLIGV